MKEEHWHFTDHEKLYQLYKDYGAENGLTFKEFKKWVEGEANRLLRQVKK